METQQYKTELGMFLSGRKILILDSNEITRNYISNLLVQFGAKPALITMSIEYDVAVDVMYKICPDIVIIDFKVKNGSGLDLASEFSKIRQPNSIFVMITDNSQQSLTAASAEEDVDTYISKPYTSHDFSKMLSKAAAAKLTPSEYTNKINGGKKFLAQKSWDEAIAWFNNAINENNKAPTLAYYYRSQAEIQKFLYDIAEQSLKKGLQYNEYHYKCLTGLFDLLLERDKIKDAYDIVKKLTTFPLNPKRLSRVIELAVRTAQYSDMDKYYDFYKTIEVKDEELNRHISAALVVSSKMLFKKGEMFKAASYLKKATHSAKDRPGILLEIVTTLAFNGFIPNAKEALEQFTPEMHHGFQYRVACAMVAYFENPKPGTHIKILMDAIEEGVHEPEYFYWLIAFLHVAKRADLLKQYTDRALNHWPEKAEFFKKALKAIPTK